MTNFDCIEPKIENILKKNQNGFQRNRSTSQILTIHWILESVHAKNLEATILFVNFAKAFDSIHRGKMEQILLAYSLPKETVAAIMMLYKNIKVKVCSPDGDTEYFNIVAGVLQEDTLAPYLFIICLDYVLRMPIDKMKDKGFKLTKERTRRYPILAKAWTAIDRLSVIWKSDLTNKIKCSFFKPVAITQECSKQYWTSLGGNIPQSSSCTATYHPSWKLSKLDEPDMRDTAGEVETNS